MFAWRQPFYFIRCNRCSLFVSLFLIGSKAVNYVSMSKYCVTIQQRLCLPLIIINLHRLLE